VKVRAFAPGRINVIGDHTDYTEGLVLPAAIELGTTVEMVRGGQEVRLRSSHVGGEARVALTVAEPSRLRPRWARYVGGVVAELRPQQGGEGRITTTLPVGVGLSSSAALEVATALALGFEESHLALAQLCQRAEARAAGVPCGIMDPLASAGGVDGALLLIDCRSLAVTPIRFPPRVALLAIDSHQKRTLAATAYADRRRECEAAADRIGPLRDATLADTEKLSPVLRRRARHVVTENSRVTSFATAVEEGDMIGAGALMIESHRSLRDDFEVSVPVVDQLVEQLHAIPGVFGARMTGGGFGGMIVALAEEGIRIPPGIDVRRVHPSRGASVDER
jgi:galactokinase